MDGEGAIKPSTTEGMVRTIGPFGEDAGEQPASDLEMYAINRQWLHETLLRLMKPLLIKRASQILDPDLTLLGAMQIDGAEVPVYFARRLDDLKTVGRLDLALRARNKAGVGIVLAASPETPQAPRAERRRAAVGERFVGRRRVRALAGWPRTRVSEQLLARARGRDAAGAPVGQAVSHSARPGKGPVEPARSRSDHDLRASRRRRKGRQPGCAGQGADGRSSGLEARSRRSARKPGRASWTSTSARAPSAATGAW